ncbi:hypothetical protein IBP95_000214 [Vibrio vulnificus]|nr:hypothetical protein [Vibrio vulnificus]
MTVIDQTLVDSNFRMYHLNVIKRWVNNERDGLEFEMVCYSLEILKNCEGFTLQEIAQNSNLTLEQICELNAQMLLQSN